MNDRLLKLIAGQTNGAVLHASRDAGSIGLRAGNARTGVVVRRGPGRDAIRESAGSQAAAFPGQSKAHHSYLLERWAVARRHVRSQARPGKIRRGSRFPRESADGCKTGAAFPSPFKFKKYGHSGIDISEFFARTANMRTTSCVIRSMYADVPNHEPSLMLMNCG